MIISGGTAKQLGVLSKKKKNDDERKGRKERILAIGSISTSEHIWSTFSSPFYTYYIPFRSLGSQESNASNGVQIEVETKKLWSLQENCSELKENFALCESRCETPSWHMSAISYTSSQFSHGVNQGAKFIPTCEILSPRCEFSKHQFCTLLFKVRKFSHRAKHLLAHECHFTHLKPILAPCETRCENFAHHNSRCEIHSNVRMQVRKFCYYWTHF